MGFTPTVNAGDLIQASHINELRDRTAQRFATVAERAAQWPSPPRGAVSVVDDWPGTVHIYDGTGWVVVQTGYAVITTTPSSTVTYTFPRPFTSVPAVMLQGEGTAVLQVEAAVLTAQVTATTANFVFRTLQPPNTIGSVPSTAVGFAWWARGYS